MDWNFGKGQDRQVIRLRLDEETNLINGKNWCIIEPLKIKGVKVTKENNKEVIKYFVTECSNESDYNKEWDFKEHKPIND